LGSLRKGDSRYENACRIEGRTLKELSPRQRREVWILVITESVQKKGSRVY